MLLPVWVQWCQALLLLVISGLGAWIAYKQVRIATAKLNLDLYDKRFKVFEAARDFVVKVLQHADVENNDFPIFNIGVADAVFLFDGDVNEYLTGLRKSVAALHAMNSQLSAMNADDANRGALVDRIHELNIKFMTEYERLVTTFKPYLKLGNI